MKGSENSTPSAPIGNSVATLLDDKKAVTDSSERSGDM